MADEQIDVAIIGGGPAGAAAAIEATAANLSTVVVDKAVFPRDKCCGDGLTVAALRHLEDLGLDHRTIPSWKVVSDVVVSGPGRRSVRFPLPPDDGQFAAVVRRSELDATLVDVAVKSGADLREGEPLVGLTPRHDRVVVETPASRLAASFVVAADGMWSPSRKLLGLGATSYRGEWHAFRQYFTNIGTQAERDLVVWFEPDLLPGYVWSFPLADGSANIGFGIQRGRGVEVQSMRRLWLDLLDRPHIRAVIGSDPVAEETHKSWPIPARLGRLPLTAERVFFAGDATAATDPMTGEGIGQAIETGRLAVQSIVTANFDPAEAGERYESTLRAGMVHDHRLAAALSTILSRRWGASGAIAVAGLTPWTRRNFARWLFEDYPRAVIGTPRRWGRGLFAGPGAYRG